VIVDLPQGHNRQNTGEEVTFFGGCGSASMAFLPAPASPEADFLRLVLPSSRSASATVLFAFLVFFMLSGSSLFFFFPPLEFVLLVEVCVDRY